MTQISLTYQDVEDIAIVSSLTKLERGYSLESNEVRERSETKGPRSDSVRGFLGKVIPFHPDLLIS
jgi:hypothetical protein